MLFSDLIEKSGSATPERLFIPMRFHLLRDLVFNSDA